MAYLPIKARALARAATTGTRKIDQKDIEACLISSASGPVAQAIHMRGGPPVTVIDKVSWETFDGRRDYEVAEDIRESTRKRLPVFSLEDAAEQAHELLRRRDTWESVQRVAAELVRFKELGYDDLKYLIY